MSKAAEMCFQAIICKKITLEDMKQLNRVLGEEGRIVLDSMTDFSFLFITDFYEKIQKSQVVGEVLLFVESALKQSKEIEIQNAKALVQNDLLHFLFSLNRCEGEREALMLRGIIILSQLTLLIRQELNDFLEKGKNFSLFLNFLTLFDSPLESITRQIIQVSLYCLHENLLSLTKLSSIKAFFDKNGLGILSIWLCSDFGDQPNIATKIAEIYALLLQKVSRQGELSPENQFVEFFKEENFIYSLVKRTSKNVDNFPMVSKCLVTLYKIAAVDEIMETIKSLGILYLMVTIIAFYQKQHEEIES